jgi:hypothetical protein
MSGKLSTARNKTISSFPCCRPTERRRDIRGGTTSTVTVSTRNAADLTLEPCAMGSNCDKFAAILIETVIYCTCSSADVVPSPFFYIKTLPSCSSISKQSGILL